MICQVDGDVTLSPNDIHAIRLSLQVSVIATVAFTPICVGLGIWLARTRSRARLLVQSITTVPLVLPPVVTGLCLLKILVALGSPIVFTWQAAVLASGLVAAPLLIRSVRNSAEAMDARLPAAAATLGASRLRILWSITLPCCWKGVVGGTVLFWARALGEFGAVMVVATNTPGRTQTIPLAIYSKLESAEDRTIWPLVLAALVVSLIAIFLSEWLVRDPRNRRARNARQT